MIVYMSRLNVESVSMVFSPMGVTAACMAGPAMRPMLWPMDRMAVCVVRSSIVVTLDTYRRAAALMLVPMPTMNLERRGG